MMEKIRAAHIFLSSYNIRSCCVVLRLLCLVKMLQSPTPSSGSIIISPAGGRADKVLAHFTDETKSSGLGKEEGKGNCPPYLTNIT